MPMRCEQESVRDVTKWWWVEVAGVRREKFEILRAWRLERHTRARALEQFEEWRSSGKPSLSKLLPAVVGKPTETEVSSSSNSEKPNTVGDIFYGPVTALPESIPTNTKWIPRNVVRHVTSYVLVAHESAAAGSEPAAAGHISESGLEPAVAGSRSNEQEPAVAGSPTRWKRGVLKRK